MEEYKKLFFKLAFLLFLTFNSEVFAYQLSENEVREIETVDNELCLAKGHSLDTEYSTRLYWDCRLMLMNKRIEESRRKGIRSKFYTAELKIMRRVIKNIISKIESDFSDKLEYYTEKEDKEVELRGKDKYYYNLLKFSRRDHFLLDVNTKREIKNILETRKSLVKQKEKDKVKENLEKYPECIVYNVDTVEFENCINFKIQIEECRKAVVEKLNSKQNENKFKCKQQSIEKYPDHMALYNNEYMDLKNEKVDIYNINREKEEQKRKRLAELNKLMSGPRLSSIQLINLRKFEEQKCLIDKELENNLFKVTVSNECENLLKIIKSKTSKENKKSNPKEQLTVKDNNIEKNNAAEKIIEKKEENEKKEKEEKEEENNIGKLEDNKSDDKKENNDNGIPEELNKQLENSK